MLLAQARLYRELSDIKPVVLIDDLGAELDGDNLSRVLQELREQQVQAFITTVELVSSMSPQQGEGLFHVEQGALRNVVE